MEGRPSGYFVHTLEEWEDLKKAHGYRCLYCGRHESELKRPLTRDHLVPKAEGGTSEIENIAPACESCNGRKGPRDWQYWIRLWSDEPWTAIDAVDDPQPWQYHETYIASMFPHNGVQIDEAEWEKIMDRLRAGLDFSAQHPHWTKFKRGYAYLDRPTKRKIA